MTCDLTHDLFYTRESENILNDHARRCKHADTAMLELCLTEPSDIHPFRDAQRVEANVAGLLRSQLLVSITSYWATKT